MNYTRRQFLGRIGASIAGALLAQAGLDYVAPSQERIEVISEITDIATIAFDAYYGWYTELILMSPRQHAALERYSLAFSFPNLEITKQEPKPSDTWAELLK